MTDAGSQTPAAVDSLTPEAAGEEIGATMSDAKHAYFDQRHPGHEAALDRMSKLYAKRYGDAQPGDRRTQAVEAHEDEVAREAAEEQAAAELHPAGRLTDEDLANLPPPPEGYESWSKEAIAEGVDFGANVLGLNNAEVSKWTGTLIAAMSNPDSVPSAEKVEAELRHEFGLDYEAKIAAADGVFATFPEVLRQQLLETGACNHPDFIRKLAQIGGQREEAQSRYDQIMGDKSHPYWNKFDRRNDAAMLEVQKLLRIIHGRK